MPQNDFFGLKTACNGAGNGENGLETTKYAKIAKIGEKMAENKGRTTNGANGTNGEENGDFDRKWTRMDANWG